MEDLKFIRAIFNGLKTLWNCLFAIAAVILVVATFNGEGGCLQWLIILVSGALIWLVGMVIINIGSIVYTRFVAATENIFKITQILEKKLND